jgi:hypothetical protein
LDSTQVTGSRAARTRLRLGPQPARPFIHTYNPQLQAPSSLLTRQKRTEDNVSSVPLFCRRYSSSTDLSLLPSHLVAPHPYGPDIFTALHACFFSITMTPPSAQYLLSTQGVLSSAPPRTPAHIPKEQIYNRSIYERCVLVALRPPGRAAHNINITTPPSGWPPLFSTSYSAPHGGPFAYAASLQSLAQTPIFFISFPALHRTADSGRSAPSGPSLWGLKRGEWKDASDGDSLGLGLRLGRLRVSPLSP